MLCNWLHILASSASTFSKKYKNSTFVVEAIYNLLCSQFWHFGSGCLPKHLSSMLNHMPLKPGWWSSEHRPVVCMFYWLAPGSSAGSHTPASPGLIIGWSRASEVGACKAKWEKKKKNSSKHNSLWKTCMYESLPKAKYDVCAATSIILQKSMGESDWVPGCRVNFNIMFLGTMRFYWAAVLWEPRFPSHNTANQNQSGSDQVWFLNSVPVISRTKKHMFAQQENMLFHI